jgi:eukaryotic-like serine/threonine-protein kinase
MSEESMTPTISHKSLAERLHEGKLPVSDALRFAMTMADQLRRLHDSGRVYGALTPESIALTANSVELVPPPEHVTLTPYTAPEVIRGSHTDARSDIFAFGAILFEMLTGRRAFEGNDEGSLVANITEGPTPSSGSPLVDRLVASCCTKDPAVRCQRMQKIIMELKLLSVAARRSETPAPNKGQAEAQLRAEMQQIEARAAARIEMHEKATAQMHEAHARSLADHARVMQDLRDSHTRTISEMQQASDDALHTLRAQIAEMTARIVESQERMDQPIAEVRAMGDQIAARVQQTIEPLGQRLADAEESLQDFRNRTIAVQDSVSADLSNIEQSLSAHSTAIDSARTAMAQTDDLVERVVEALELLQTSVLEQREERGALID